MTHQSGWRRTVLSCIGGAVCGLTAAMPAFAQAQQPQQQGPSFITAASTSSKPVLGLIGSNVMSRDHKLVGVIDDLIGASDGQLTYAVIGLGGFLGVGEKDIAVPIRRLKVLRAPPSQLATDVPFRTREFGGAGRMPVEIDADVSDLIKAPSFTSSKGLGQPSSATTTPENVKGAPKSSTESGGPG